MGPIVFSLQPVNAQDVQREGETKFAEHHVLGAGPLYEFMGEGPRSFTIKGVVFPEHFGGLNVLEALHTMRRAGVPQILLRGDGALFGWVVIEKVTEQHETLGFTGVGREIKFSVDVKVAGPPTATSIFDLFSAIMQ